LKSLSAGPAGTGTTESVKALGHQLGRFVLVFNCDETFDVHVSSLLSSMNDCRITFILKIWVFFCLNNFSILEFYETIFG
jgi:hypothetical protein